MNMLDALIFAAVISLITLLLAPFWWKTNFDPFYLFLFISAVLMPGFWVAITGSPFVSSSKKRQRAMVAMAKIKKGEIVYDAGCGDGSLVFAAGGLGAKAIGYDMSIPLFLWGRFQMLRHKGVIRYGNLWKQDYRDADVIFCYLLPKAMEKFYRTLWPTLKKGTRVICNAFPLESIAPKKVEGKVYLYVK